jgi:hypothetical protein
MYMENDPQKEGIAEFKMDLESQYMMYKDNIIPTPRRSLIERGYKYYSQLSEDEKKKYSELKKVFDGGM